MLEAFGNTNVLCVLKHTINSHSTTDPINKIEYHIVCTCDLMNRISKRQTQAIAPEFTEYNMCYLFK